MTLSCMERMNDFLANDGLLTGNPVLAASPGTKEAMQKLFAAAGH